MQKISYEQQALECRKLASEMKNPVQKSKWKIWLRYGKRSPDSSHSKTNKSESASNKTA